MCKVSRNVLSKESDEKHCQGKRGGHLGSQLRGSETRELTRQKKALS